MSEPSAQTLFQHLIQDAVSCEKMSFIKKSLLVPCEKFEKFQNAFVNAEGKYQGKGMRTKEAVLHLHANVNGEYVEIHIDHGNPLSGNITGLVHVVMDVFPYTIFCVVKHGRWHVPAMDAHKKR